MLLYEGSDVGEREKDMDTEPPLSGAAALGQSGGNNNNAPGTIDFTYCDTDVHQNEVAELYSYNEELDFTANRTAFEELMEDYGFPLKWSHALPSQKARVVEKLAEGLELTERWTRVRAVRALLYLAQGNFADCSTAEEQSKFARENIFQLYEYGLFPLLVQLIHFEVEQAMKLDAPGSASVTSAPTPPTHANSITSIAPNDPNTSLKLLITIVYLFVLEMSRPQGEGEDGQLAERFKEELMQPIAGELLHLTLFELVIKLCQNTGGMGAKFPMKKILLLLWKTMLLTLGGSDRLRALKDHYRARAGLKPVPDDTLEVTRRLRPASPPPTAVEIIDSAHQRKLNRPFKRQTVVKQSSFGDGQENNNNNSNGNGNGNNNNGNNNSYGGEEVSDDDLLNDDPFENGNGNDTDVGENGELGDSNKRRKGENMGEPGSPRPGSPVPEEQSTHGSGGHHHSEAAHLKQTLLINSKSLPWIPKVRQKEIDVFLAQVRKKFIGYVLPEGEYRDTTAGLPAPILESIEILKKHLYESLGEVQVAREEDIARYPLTMGELDEQSVGSFAETLYRTLLPSLPQYLISLLKLLLASVSSVKTAKGEATAPPTASPSAAAANVLSDVGVTSASVPVSSGVTSVAASVLQSLKLKLDLNRHQEIIIKAISAILLLLLKHYKLNHVYQFEYISQQLMFANCIPLVIKFISQEMGDFITAKNSIPGLDFPSCVIGEGQGSAEMSAETIDAILAEDSAGQGSGGQSTQPVSSYYCWRNMFSSINLLRILNKLSKWKNCRIMMLVLFKSAQPLKRSLRIRQAMFQVYALKLLKMQAKFLGRQWRKNNMKTMSAIYQKVRHRLNDDWAFANDVDSKQLYFQTEEFLLQANINRFHNRRYEKPFPVANMVNSVTAQALSTSASSTSFKINDYGGGNSGGQNSYPGTPSTPLSAAASMFFDGGGGAASAALAATHLAPGIGPTLAALYEADLFTPVDNNLQSVLGRKVQLTSEFKRNYESWMEREVFYTQIDWDDLMGTDPRSTSPLTATQLHTNEAANEQMDTESHCSTVVSATSTILRRSSVTAAAAKEAVPTESLLI